MYIDQVNETKHQFFNQRAHFVVDQIRNELEKIGSSAEFDVSVWEPICKNEFVCKTDDIVSIGSKYCCYFKLMIAGYQFHKSSSIQTLLRVYLSKKCYDYKYVGIQITSMLAY